MIKGACLISSTPLENRHSRLLRQVKIQVSPPFLHRLTPFANPVQISTRFLNSLTPLREYSLVCHFPYPRLTRKGLTRISPVRNLEGLLSWVKRHCQRYCSYITAATLPNSCFLAFPLINPTQHFLQMLSIIGKTKNPSRRSDSWHMEW